jgi:hypothetical protein
MKRVLTTTALLTVLLTSSAMAQSEIVPPEGYTVYETALTTELLRGANVYDSTGEVVGEIHDLVLGTTGGVVGDAATGGSTAPATEGMTDGAATTNADTAADPATGETAVSGDTGIDATAPDVSTTDTGSGDAASADVATGDATTTEGTAPEATASEGTEMTGTGLSPDGATGSDPAVTESTDTATSDAPADQTTESMAKGEITHAILDVGGFLGMGEHRIAVPVSDLQLYRGSGDDVRIYLPWSREQLEAQPAYEEGNLSTLGQPMTSP